MPVSTPEKGSPKLNSLVVCAGTVDIKDVHGMSAGFQMFKETFGFTEARKQKNEWEKELQKVLDAHFKSLSWAKAKPIPPYITLDKARTSPTNGNLLGGVATVPRMNDTIRNLSPEKRNKIYEDAVRGAVVAAKNAHPKRPLFMQPLGVGVYGWDATEAAKSFAKVIQEEDPASALDITINIHDTSPGSNDMIFKRVFNTAMQNTAKFSAVKSSAV